ncbi:MAG: hypothetical protein V4580_07075 [Bacteroidota bacterium]
MKFNISQYQNDIKKVTAKLIIKKSITLLAVGLLFSFNISAKEDGTPKTIVIEDATTTMKQHIKFPDLLTFKKEERVNVVFTVNEAGNVNLVVVNTFNENLKKSIESQFMKLKLNNLKANNAYSVIFNFKTI